MLKEQATFEAVVVQSCHVVDRRSGIQRCNKIVISCFHAFHVLFMLLCDATLRTPLADDSADVVRVEAAVRGHPLRRGSVDGATVARLRRRPRVEVVGAQVVHGQSRIVAPDVRSLDSDVDETDVRKIHAFAIHLQRQELLRRGDVPLNEHGHSRAWPLACSRCRS